MRDRIITTKTTSLLTLFLGIFFAFGLMSCERSVPTSSDVTLVGTAWQGTVATKDTKGQIVEVSVKISFHGNSVGHWHFEEDPAPFLGAWDEGKMAPLPESDRFSTFSYFRFSEKVLELRGFRNLYEPLIADWMITERTKNKFSLTSRAALPSRTVWLKLKRIP